MKSLVITFIGDDRTGIVESLSELIIKHQGEWIESRMANLSGKFAGILQVDIPPDFVDAFTEDILSKQISGLSISVEAVSDNELSGGQCYKLELVGQDRPGIIHRISSVLASNGATVDELETEVCEASMSGEKLFKAFITLCVKEGQSIDELSDALEDLANELIVDIELG